MDRRLFLSLVAGCAAWPSIAHAVSRPPIALRRLRLVNAHTGETFEGAYRNDKGPIERVIDELCIFSPRPSFRGKDADRRRGRRLPV
jgi:hypothetical protein